MGSAVCDSVRCAWHMSWTWEALYVILNTDLEHQPIAHWSTLRAQTYGLLRKVKGLSEIVPTFETVFVLAVACH